MYSVLMAAVLAGAGSTPADSYGSYGSYGDRNYSPYGDRGYYYQPMILPALPYVDGTYGNVPKDRKALEPIPPGSVPYYPLHPDPYLKNPWLGSPPASKPLPSVPGRPQTNVAKPPVNEAKPAGPASAGKPKAQASNPHVRYLDKNGQTDEPPLLIKGADRGPEKKAPEIRKEEPAKPNEPALRPQEKKAKPQRRNDPFAVDSQLDDPAVAKLLQAAPVETKAGEVKTSALNKTEGRPGTMAAVQASATPANANGVPANRARLVVTIPPMAKLYVNGQVVQGATSPSSYLTPELRTDTRYFYTVHVEVAQNGAVLVSEVKQVYFQPGTEVRVSLDNVAMFAPASAPGSL